MTHHQQHAAAAAEESATSDYCGLDCSFLLEQQDFILDMIKMHSDYDAEFAPVMVQKLIDKCNEVKTELMTNLLQAKALVGISRVE